MIGFYQMSYQTLYSVDLFLNHIKSTRLHVYSLSKNGNSLNLTALIDFFQIVYKDPWSYIIFACSFKTPFKHFSKLELLKNFQKFWKTLKTSDRITALMKFVLNTLY